MLHVATDNASAPPAFTCSPFFPPFFLSIYSIHAIQSAAMVRRLHSNLSQFQLRPAVARTGLAHIRAGVGQLISGTGLMHRRVCGERSAEKNYRSASAGVMFSNFLCMLAKRGFDIALYITPVFSRLWAVPESGRRLGV